MYAAERQQLIETLVASEGRVVVVDLARRFGVTTETVRRDLDQMETSGLVRRVHGGAVSRSRRSTAEPSLAERKRLTETIRNLHVPAVFLEPNLAARSSTLVEVAKENWSFGLGVAQYAPPEA